MNVHSNISNVVLSIVKSKIDVMHNTMRNLVAINNWN